MPGLFVTKKETGEQLTIPQDVYQANPEAYQLAEGQQVLYDPTGGVAYAPAAYEVSPELLEAPIPGAELTPEQRSEVIRGRVAEERFGGFGQQAKQAIRGTAAGATFGLSELALRAGETTFEREEEEAKRELFATEFAAGELVGDIAASLGTGAAGVAGKIARVTPVGALTHTLGKAAAGKGLRGAVAAGATEAAAHMAGNYLATSAIRGEPLSLDALAGQVSTGALLGGGLTGAVGLLGRGITKVSGAALQDAAQHGGDDLARLLQGAENVSLGRAADDLSKVRRRKPVRLQSLFSKRGRSPEITRRGTTELIGQIENRAGRGVAVRSALDDAVAAANATGQPLPQELIDRVSLAIQDHTVTAERASRWAPDLAKEVEAATTGAQIKVSREGVDSLRALDAADRDLVDSIRVIRDTIPTPAAGSPQAGLFARMADAVGVMETAQSLGAKLPDLDKIPGVGPLLSGLAKIRTGYRAAAGLGLVPGTNLTDYAQSAAKLANGFGRIMTRLTSGRSLGAPVAGIARAVRKGVSMNPGKAFRLTQNFEDQDPAALEAAVKAQYPGLPEDLQRDLVASANRRVDYLRSIAPKPPPGYGALTQRWQPTPVQARRFGEVVAALDNPVGAVGDVFAGRWSYITEVVAGVHAVYPELYAQTQIGITENAPRIARNNPRALVALWGRLFQAPILPELQPSFTTPTPEEPAVAAPALGAFPTSPTKSAVAEATETRPHMTRG